MSETIANPIFEVSMPVPVLPKAEQEYRAFLRLLPGLLGSHRGKYVAVHEGQVIDSDTSDIVLIQRVHAKIGYLPIYVGLISEERQVARLPHYREYRPVGDRS
jgi:hypothetical protein